MLPFSLLTASLVLFLKNFSDLDREDECVAIICPRGLLANPEHGSGSRGTSGGRKTSRSKQDEIRVPASLLGPEAVRLAVREDSAPTQLPRCPQAAVHIPVCLAHEGPDEKGSVSEASFLPDDGWGRFWS